MRSSSWRVSNWWMSAATSASVGSKWIAARAGSSASEMLPPALGPRRGINNRQLCDGPLETSPRETRAGRPAARVHPLKIASPKHLEEPAADPLPSGVQRLESPARLPRSRPGCHYTAKRGRSAPGRPHISAPVRFRTSELLLSNGPQIQPAVAEVWIYNPPCFHGERCSWRLWQ
jgi:hypothetical protein